MFVIITDSDFKKSAISLAVLLACPILPPYDTLASGIHELYYVGYANRDGVESSLQSVFKQTHLLVCSYYRTLG